MTTAKAVHFLIPLTTPSTNGLSLWAHTPRSKAQNRTQNRKHRNRKRYAQQTGQHLNHGSLDLGLNKQIHYNFETIL